MGLVRAHCLLPLIVGGMNVVHPLGAQSGSYTGRVLSGSSSLPLKGAEIVLTAVDRSTRTDSHGRFRIERLRAGRYEVLIRMPGFRAITDMVSITEGAELTKEYKLSGHISTLDSVRVTARTEYLSARMRTFERRRAEGFGKFFTAEQLRKNEDLPLRAVLARVPGLRFVTYESATFAALARGMGSLRAPRAVPWDASSPRQCWVQIYLDAIRIYAPMARSRESPDAGQPVPNVDDYRVRDLEAAEFYAGPAETPAELGGTGATCGTLVLWTREK